MIRTLAVSTVFVKMAFEISTLDLTDYAREEFSKASNSPIVMRIGLLVY